MKKNLLLMLLLAALALPLNGFAATMKIAHGNPQDAEDPYQVLALAFQEKLKELHPDIKVMIFPAGQIGAESTAFQDAQNGIVQGVILASGNISPFATSYSVLDLPYIFRNTEEFSKVLVEAEDDLARVMINESEMRPIAWGIQGFRVISNGKKSVKNIDDLHGLKIRLPNNAIQLATFKEWGSDGVPLAFGELFGALQQQVVDGLEMTYISLATQKMYEVQKYVSDVRYKLAINPLVVSEAWFQEQSPEAQKAIIEAGKYATKVAFDASNKMDDLGKKILQENGMTLDPQPVDEQVWIEKSYAVWPQFYTLIKDQAFFDKVLSILDIKKPQ